jgi:hypothetical protein
MITTESKALNERKAILWVVRAISYLVYFYLIVVEIILFIGFFLLLFGANPSAGFTEWAYRNLDRVMDPFRGIFSPIELGTTGNDVPATFDTSVLFAMIIYGIIALLFSALIGWLSSRLNQIHAAEDELERQAEVAERQAEIDARMLATQQAAAQAAAAQAAQAQAPAASGAPTSESPAPVAPTPPSPIPPTPPSPPRP